MTPKKPSLDPWRSIRKEIIIARPLPEVFAYFTREFATWWPLASHSLGREGSGGVAFPPAAGGRITEKLADGSLAVWGIVTALEAPSRVSFTWHPGRPPHEATEVEVSFSAEGESATRVILVHSGWAKLAAEPVNWRGEYDRGWDFVFGECFARRVREK